MFSLTEIWCNEQCMCVRVSTQKIVLFVICNNFSKTNQGTICLLNFCILVVCTDLQVKKKNYFLQFLANSFFFTELVGNFWFFKLP